MKIRKWENHKKNADKFNNLSVSHRHVNKFVIKEWKQSKVKKQTILFLLFLSESPRIPPPTQIFTLGSINFSVSASTFSRGLFYFWRYREKKHNKSVSWNSTISSSSYRVRRQREWAHKAQLNAVSTRFLRESFIKVIFLQIVLSLLTFFAFSPDVLSPHRPGIVDKNNHFQQFIAFTCLLKTVHREFTAIKR